MIIRIMYDSSVDAPAFFDNEGEPIYHDKINTL
jgi:hypothetical protein